MAAPIVKPDLSQFLIYRLLIFLSQIFVRTKQQCLWMKALFPPETLPNGNGILMMEVLCLLVLHHLHIHFLIGAAMMYNSLLHQAEAAKTPSNKQLVFIQLLFLILLQQPSVWVEQQPLPT